MGRMMEVSREGGRLSLVINKEAESGLYKAEGEQALQLLQ